MDTVPPSSPWPTSGLGPNATRTLLRQTIDKHRAKPLAEILTARGLGPYRSYAEMLQAIDRRVQRGAQLLQIGRSVCDEPLFALHFGQAEPTEHTRTTVVVSGLHPMEWIGIETHLSLLYRLLDVELGDRAVIAVPIANPDGILRVEENLRVRRRRFVRHNARGVDLNRNFDVRWGHRSSLAAFVPWLYRPGSFPASEPEVASLAFDLSRRRVDRALSFHSSGGMVLYPSAHTVLPIADVHEHKHWARRIAQKAAARPYFTLPCSWFGLGVIQGGFELDWFHQRHGALSLLVECSRGGLSWRPRRLLEPFSWFNPANPAEVAARIAKATIPFVCGEPTPADAFNAD